MGVGADMKQYRYVVNGKPDVIWKPLGNLSLAMMIYKADALNEYFDNWYIEYKGEEEND